MPHPRARYAAKFVGMLSENFRQEPDALKFSRHVVRVILSVRPKCSHTYASLLVNS